MPSLISTEHGFGCHRDVWSCTCSPTRGAHQLVLETRKHLKHTSPLDFGRACSLVDHHPFFLSRTYSKLRPYSKRLLVAILLLPSLLAHTIRPVANVHLDPRTPEHDPSLRPKSESCERFPGRSATSLRKSYPNVQLGWRSRRRVQVWFSYVSLSRRETHLLSVCGGSEVFWNGVHPHWAQVD